MADYPKAPTRGSLPPDIEKAARKIHHLVWGSRYKPGEGPMHFAGGPYWHDELLRQADEWEALAAAARVAATFLPDEDDDGPDPRATGGKQWVSASR